MRDAVHLFKNTRDDLDGTVDLFFGIEATEGEAEATAGAGVAHAHGF